MRSRLTELVNRDRWLVAIMGLATLHACLLLWVTRHDSSLPPDAASYAEVARSLLRGEGDTVNHVMYHVGLSGSVRHPLETHGLLQPWLLVPLFAALGPEEWLVRVPSVASSAALLVLVFATGRALFGLSAGLVATTLMASRLLVSLTALSGTDDAEQALFCFGALTLFTRAVEETDEAPRPRRFVACGVLVALSLLSKMSALILPLALGASLLLLEAGRSKLTPRNVLALFGPLLPVLLLYAWRGHRVQGSYGALDWYGKARFRDYFALYERLPPVLTVLRQLGAGTVLRIVAHQLHQIGLFTLIEPLLLLGFLACVLLLRRRRAFAVPVLVYSIGLVLTLVLVHHAEARYLAPLYPMYAVAVGGLGSAWLARLVERLGGPGTTAWRALVAGLAVLSIGLVASHQIPLFMGFNEHARMGPECPAAVRYLRAARHPEEAVLTSNPWWVSWVTERPGVNAPTNGVDALLRVARHYRTEWALTGLFVAGTLDLEAALEDPRVVEALHPVEVLRDPPCTVYRLNP